MLLGLVGRGWVSCKRHAGEGLGRWLDGCGGKGMWGLGYGVLGVGVGGWGMGCWVRVHG